MIRCTPAVRAARPNVLAPVGVLGGEVGAVERVDQVVRGLAAGKRRAQGRLVADVAADRRACSPVPLRLPRKGEDLVTVLLERAHQPLADEPRGTRDEQLHTRVIPDRGCFGATSGDASATAGSGGVVQAERVRGRGAEDGRRPEGARDLGHPEPVVVTDHRHDPAGPQAREADLQRLVRSRRRRKPAPTMCRTDRCARTSR